MSRPVDLVVGLVDGLGGGTEQHVLALCQGLPGRGFDPAVVCVVDHEFLGTRPFPCETVALTRGTRFLWRRQAVTGLARRWRARRPAAAVAYFDNAQFAAVRAAGATDSGPVLSARRNMGTERGSDRLVRRTNGGVARFVCNSEAVREAAIRAEDLPRERTVVLYNGIRTSPAPAEGWRPRHGVPADAPVVVCVSGMRPVKGVDAFVRAFALAARAVPGARAVLVGDGPGRPALEALVERLGLRERVHFDGWREDVRGLLAECQVAALASLSEGFSNALLEYMAAGLPSVVTRVGGNAEALRDGEDGILVEPGDGEALAAALTRLLQDGPLRLRMGQSAARRARERFDRDVMLDGMARILEEAIASCPR